MRLEVLFLCLLAAAKVQPTPEMQEIKQKMRDLNKQLQDYGSKFESSDVWGDQTSIEKLTDQIQDVTNKMEGYEKQYKALKKEAKAAQTSAATAASTDASAAASQSSLAQDDVAKSVALTPQKVLALFSQGAGSAETAPVVASPQPSESPEDKLKQQIKDLKKKLNDFGKDFSDSSVYSDSKKIQDLVGKIEDAQVEMSKDYEKLDQLKKAAKKAAEKAAAQKAEEEKKAAEEAAKAAEATPESSAAPSVEQSSEAPSTTETPTTEAPTYTKQPLLLVAVDSEPSFGLWWTVGACFVLGFLFSVYRAYGRKLFNSTEVRPLLRRDEYYQCA